MDKDGIEPAGDQNILNLYGHVARMEDRTGVYRVLAGKPEGKRPLGRPRCRWEDIIKMGLQ